MRSLFFASLIASSLAACSPGSRDGSTSGDDDSGGDDTELVDGGHVSSGKVGSLSVNSWSYAYPSGQDVGSGVSAQFFPQAPSTWGSRDAGCWMTVYTATQYAQTSAGSVRFGTSPPTTLVFDGAGFYMSGTMDQPLTSGRTISIDVSGATVPAFTAAATIPSPATLTQPAFVDYETTINRASDLLVKWTGGSDTILVSVNSATPGESTFVYCAFPASTHQGTVPASMLSQLPVGMGGFSAIVQSRTQKNVGDWDLMIGATNSMATPDGAQAGGRAILQ